jgi:hypothetical protein
VVHVKHDSTDPESPLRPGQECNDFLPLTAPIAGGLVVAKTVHSAFIGTDLAAVGQAQKKPRRRSTPARFLLAEQRSAELDPGRLHLRELVEGV